MEPETDVFISYWRFVSGKAAKSAVRSLEGQWIFSLRSVRLERGQLKRTDASISAPVDAANRKHRESFGLEKLEEERRT